MAVERMIDANNVVRWSGRLVPPVGSGAIVSPVDPGAVGAGLFWLDSSVAPGVLSVRDSANTAWLPVSTPAPTSLTDIDLAARGLLSECFHILEAADDFNPDLLGVVAGAVPLRKGMSVTGVAYCVDAVGAGTAPDHFDVAVYAASGARLAVSADDAAKWASKPPLGPESTLFAAPWVVPVDGDYYLAINFVQGLGRSISFATNSFKSGVGNPYKTGIAPAVIGSGTWPSPDPEVLTPSDQAPWVAAVAN